MKEEFEQIIFKSPKTSKILAGLVFVFGVVYLYKLYAVGIYLYILTLVMLMLIDGNSIILFDTLDYKLLNRQKFFYIILIFLLGNISVYIYQYEFRKAIDWNPTYFQYDGLFNSKNCPSSGWFSGKREGKLLIEDTTGALGFGFPCQNPDSNDPTYFTIDESKIFKINYFLSEDLLVGFLFEGKGDKNLTDLRVQFVKASSNKGETSLELAIKDFKWKNLDEAKHLKMLFIQLNWYDELYAKALLFLGFEKTVAKYYLGAI